MTTAIPKLTVKQRSIKGLKIHSRNPKTHSDAQIEQIRQSLLEFGFNQPILIDEEGTIIAGHGRYLAARQLDLPKVPVVVCKGWSDQQKRAYLIADNKIAQNGKWDQDRLQEEVQWIVTSDMDSETKYAGLLGFGQNQIDCLVARAEAAADAEDVSQEQPPLRLLAGKFEVDCTPDECELLKQAYEGYRDSRGVKAGFLGWLSRTAIKTG